MVRNGDAGTASAIPGSQRPGAVMLAAGGTGGHLFPAFALAEELARRGITVDLMTDMRGDRYGTGFPAREVYRLPAATLTERSPLAMARTAWTLAQGVRAARRILASVRPGAVVGFGGYPSFAPLIAARMKRIPTALHEQNAVLGRANRLLAGRVTAIATSFEQTRLLDGALLAKARCTGNPVRDVVIEAARTPYAQPSGSGEPFHLLVFGGSQGARYFSELVPPALAALAPELRQRLRLTQQCRPEDLEAVRAAYADAAIAADVAPFFKSLPEIMARSQLVVARAGASTVAELTVMGRPAILVPLPHAVDNDQLQNASRLAESEAGWCIQQHTLSPERLAETIAGLMQSPEILAGHAAAARALGRPDAVTRLADLVVEIMGKP